MKININEITDIYTIKKILSKITYKDGKEKYDSAQLGLGVFYQYHKHDYTLAEKFYLKISRSDNPPSLFYALARYYLGEIYCYKHHDYHSAINFYRDIFREDYPKIFAIAQFQLGSIYIKQHDYETARNHYLNVLKEDNPEIFASAQFQLGNIYIEQHDYETARNHYLNVLKKDNPEIFARAQFQLGNIYFKSLMPHSFSEVEICYLNAYENINSKRIKTKLDKYRFNLINSFVSIRDNQQAYKNYYSQISYSNDYPYHYISAQLILGLMQINSSLIFNKREFNTFKNLVFDKIENICNLTKNIKESLLVFTKIDNYLNDIKRIQRPERRVAHYTKPAVLFNLLKGENPSKFRLNIVDFMNDPSENQVLTSWLNIGNHPDNEIKSFLASFSFNHNSLNQFRLYGNENNITGSGVSIAFNKNFFGLDTKRSINNEIISLHSIKSIKSFENKQVELETEQIEIKSANTLYPLPLYRCLYFDPKTGYMALAKRNKQSFYLENKNEKTPETIDREWDDYINLLNESDKISKIRTKLEAIQKLIAELSNNPELKKISNLDELLSLAVLPISCLIKHAAFEDEDECRMIYITHIADDNIVEPQDYQSANSLYVEYTHVEEYIDNIYLGPQCKMQHKIWLQNHFKKKRREREIKLIKSEMPLR